MNQQKRSLIYYYLTCSTILVFFGFYHSKVDGAPCFQLVNPTTCTDLAGSWIMPSDKFTDVPSFDAYIQSSLESSPAYIQQFNAAYGCPAFNGSLRYHSSVLCNYLASYAAPQCAESKVAITPLCQPTCTNFLMSLNQVFSDPAQCTPIDPATTDPNQKNQLNLRMNEVQKGSFAFYCQVLPNNISPTVCSKGLARDVANCGFMNSSFTASYCAANNDPCCMSQAAAILVQEIADPNTLYLFVLAAFAGVTILIIAFFVYCSYELRIRVRNTTAVFHDTKLGRKSVIATTKDELLYLDPKVSPGYNNPIGRKFTVARASYLPTEPQTMNYGSLPRNSQKRIVSARLSSGNIEEWRCIETFLPRLRDEMDAKRGDIVVVDEVYDDGWGAGTNTRTGQNGVFPMALFERVSDSLSRPKKPYQTRQPRQSSLPRRPLS